MFKKVMILTTALFILGSFTAAAQDKKTKIEKKLKIILPKVRLKNVTAEQALDFVRRLSRDMDPEGEGINIIYVKKDESDNIPKR